MVPCAHRPVDNSAAKSTRAPACGLLPHTNHVLTGCDTVFSNGEMVIAGFEVGSGCGPYWIAWFINLNMFALGLLLCPRPMFRAFVRGRRSLSMYRRREDRITLSTMTLIELRALIGLCPRLVTARLTDRFLFAAWAMVALITIVASVAMTLAMIHFGVTSFRS